VQISLDFYRILGVPTRSTPEQLQQAFEDRLQQLPRQEYSSAAIAARKQLLEEAFVELADPKKREAYDKQWADLETPADPAKGLGLMLDIADAKLSGALLLLQEVGSYQQILEIGAAYLQRPIDLTQVPTHAGALEDDVILALALANLELGREQWQQSQFEAAGDSLQKGLGLLEQEQRFSDVQAEIKGDLYKLRPYRILELLNDPDASPESRAEGLKLLQSMLDDRDGIDGNQDDQSGLSVKDFLRFIQQLREYLTVEEQQVLFEREAARPSAVASYLAVYALIARGVSAGKPNFIGQAKTLLGQLGDRQDIAIEQGMCWLLLGQPEAANKSVLLSQDQESLDFMRQYSEGSPDLIPGLYLYTENWLQQEVYPYFRDLAGQLVSLQHYFNDPAIQTILSSLDSSTQIVVKSKDKESSPRVESPKTSPGVSPQPSAPRERQPETTLASSGLPSSLLFEDELGANATPLDPFPEPQKRQRRLDPKPKTPSAKGRNSRRAGASRNEAPQNATPRGSKSKKWSTWLISLLLGAGFVTGALALARLISPQPDATEVPPPLTAEASVSPSPSPTTSLTPPPSSSSGSSPSGTGTPSVLSSGNPSASASPSPVANPGTLSKSEAEDLVKSWQAAKAEAMSEQYSVATLQAVLVEPALSEWKNRVAQNKAAKGYWKYTLDQLEIQSVDTLAKGRSAIKARVKETAQYYERGKLVSAQSYTDTYPVKYTAVQKGQQWHIQAMQVL
jgi:curved DNA-binding protein CbpA